MVFAAIDLTRYLLRRGRYHPSCVYAAGGRHSLSAPGDQAASSVTLFFVHPVRSPASWAIMYLTSSLWSHVGMLFPEGTVIDAVPQGMQKHSLRTYDDGKNYIARVQLPMPQERGDEIRAFSEAQVGKEYNWRGVFRLGLVILSGAHPSWTWRFTVDALLLLTVLAVALREYSAAMGTLVVLGFTYGVVLATNRWWLSSHNILWEARDVTPAMLWAGLASIEAAQRASTDAAARGSSDTPEGTA